MYNLSDILNWRRLDKNITLSGQPTNTQLSDIRDLGVSCIINLGPHSHKDALKDEEGTVTALGMNYVYIPVDFGNPTDEDYYKFCEALRKTQGQIVHVHCIFNARVTAFFYRYAKSGKGNSANDAFAIMDGIWKPGGVWAKFIGNEEDVNLSNRYAGYHY